MAFLTHGHQFSYLKNSQLYSGLGRAFRRHVVDSDGNRDPTCPMGLTV